MWYFYDLNLLKTNEIQSFTEDFEKVMINLFDEKSDILEDYLLGFDDSRSQKSIYDYLEKLRLEYLKLSQNKKNKFRKIFINNYQVKRILNKEIKAYTSKELEIQCGKNISDAEKELSKFIYEKLKTRASFTNKYINPLEYYKKLITEGVAKNNCPFCGQSIFESGNLGVREPYDHYIPRAIYPFVSLHYYNLVPMCHKCNSSFKLKKDILSIYPKVFDPFKIESSENELFIKKISISKNGRNIKNIKIKNKLGYTNEIDAWDKIFKIKARSKEMLNSLYDQMLQELQLIIIEEEIEDEESLIKVLKRKKFMCGKFKYVGLNLFYESLYKYYLENPNEYKILLKR